MIFYAAEHLGQALPAAYGDGTRKTRFRFRELREVPLEDCGGVEEVCPGKRINSKNHLVEIETICHILSVLVAKRSVFKLRRDKLTPLAERLRAAVAAE